MAIEKMLNAEEKKQIMIAELRCHTFDMFRRCGVTLLPEMDVTNQKLAIEYVSKLDRIGVIAPMWRRLKEGAL